ncbi:MAG TPA: RagB/SusD family nutrient uptake outer membrane protein [Niabella sp.]|nr:RagB/SusD family nutrient uptake outer membrane protein [Niabella sp.]HOZ98499.1 RagB/SusD family nutrient uptake outer membrane protein [Niabella sp.]HQW15990.1 RagB/SusD family nutrient uptake outer membrane protein [Niabella sp.]HQX21258.1 RagB/SusD family nutrient uptake outer membrane protein [Niabella sp.]HQX42060.1 RagB/SusD family nutrient uptake outer membrane protein [Niabella sp.]
MNFNNIFIKSFYCFAAMVILASCKKWIEYNPHEDFNITEQDYLKTESDYRTMAVSVYTPIQWINQVVPIGDIASDNAVAGGESASDVLSFQQIDDFTVTPVNSTLTEIWQSAYEGINRANYLHQYKDKNIASETVSFAGKEALYGEIYFLRAYYYFTLVKMFGDVPLFVDKRLTLSDSKTLSRTAKADVYKQIETDLGAAINVLPAIQVQKGRITKYAAQALLGKVLLYQNKFDAAAAILENVITSNAFSLVNDFGSIFLSTGENGPESVFEIQYSNTSPYYNWGGTTRGQGNYAVQQCGIRGLNGSAAMPYAPGWSTNLPTKNLALTYAAGDKRKDVTVMDIEAYKAANSALNITYQVAPYKNTGLYNQKYLPRKGQTSGQVELNYLNNYRTIRYADVLLMAAEANTKATTANETKARSYLNLVRRRAFGDNAHDISATGVALYDAILGERRMELGMEGERFFDLVRTGKAASVLGSTGFVSGKNELFPIPQTEVDNSGLTQNNGY